MAADGYDPWANTPDWGGRTEEEFRALQRQLGAHRIADWEAERVAAEVRYRLRYEVIAKLGYDGRRLAIWEDRKAGLSLAAIGDKYGLTKERVRQIIAKENKRIERRKYFNGLRRQKGEVE